MTDAHVILVSITDLWSSLMRGSCTRPAETAVPTRRTDDSCHVMFVSVAD